MDMDFDTAISRQHRNEFLRLSDRNPEVIEEPFFWFVIKDFFPEELYQALYDEFPKQEAFARKLGEGKRFITPVDISKVIAASPA